MLEEMSAEDLHDWIAYEQIAGPIGKCRDDYLNAQLCATVANLLRPPKSDAHKVEEFLLFPAPWNKRTGAGGSGGTTQGIRTKDPAVLLAILRNMKSFGVTVTEGKPEKPR